jgi:HAD superfamily hydrolase (TIGR01509 family)
MKNLKQKILNKKAILWDFDGCLCDSERIHFLAYEKAFLKYNHTLSEYEYFETFTHTGGGVAQEIEKYHIKCDPDKIRAEKAIYYWEFISNRRATIYPEIPKILSIIKKNKIINAIASNSPASEINLILSQNKETESLIDMVVGLEQGMRKKPFPDLYLKALELLKLQPSEVLVIEDSERGIIAAHKAECESIWVKTSLNQRFETKAPYIARLTHAQILEILE